MNGCINNNIFMTEDVIEPYVGQLYINNLQSANKKDKDVAILKLKSN